MHPSISQHLCTDTVTRMLLDMLRTNTSNPPGNELTLAASIGQQMEQCGITPRMDIFAPGRANVLGRITGSGERPALLLNGHLDVVPPGETAWRFPPFDPQVAEGKVWGRGATDMKAGLAAMLMALLAVKQSGLPLRGDLLYLGTGGEEAGSIGALDFTSRGGLEGVGQIVVGEPTACQVAIAEKGALWLRLSVTGKTAHCAFPGHGRNAVTFMMGVLTEILTWDPGLAPHPLLGSPTLTLSMLQGGVKENVVPDHCTAVLDMRSIPPMSHQDFVRHIEAICTSHVARSEGYTAHVAVLNDCPAVETSPTHPVILSALDVASRISGQPETAGCVSFYTDAAVFTPHSGIPTIIYGPGETALAHQPDEHVCLEQLYKAMRFYAAYIEEALIA